MTAAPRSKADTRIAVIGLGMAGILASIKLQKAGYTNHTVYEKGDAPGGTWRENTYPGLSCDVPAHIYCYSFEQNPEWNSTYAKRQEIYDYFDRVSKKYGVYEHTKFGQEVTSCIYRDGSWHLRTKAGLEDKVDFVIAATGVLHHPKVPDLPGLDSFEGQWWHSARWNHDVDLSDKRVGLIGTGSTATNLVCALSGNVGRLDLYQRTPQWVMPVEDVPVSEEEKAELRANPEKLNALRVDAIENFANWFSNAVIDENSEAMAEIEATCRANLETQIKDPELRRKLTPDYRPACKRLVFSEHFYTALQKPGTHLVDTGIEQIEANGIRTKDGALHELDVIVMCTGFHVDNFIRPTEVKGRNGMDLDQFWAEKPTAYLAMTMPDFPNMFMLNGPGGPVGNISLVTVSEEQMDYILQLMDEVMEGRCREICVSHDAMTRFENDRKEAAKKSIWATGCNSWYLDKDGIPTTWPWGPEYFDKVMATPNLDDFDRQA